MIRVASRLALALFVASALSISPRDARADDAPAEAREADAAARYGEGLKLLQENQPAAALAALDASLALLPSANTLLLRGHALRQLGRRAEAMAVYEEVVRSAGARVRLGEERFKPTLSDAGRWVAILRSELGEVAVEVGGAPEGTTVTLDGLKLDVTGDARAPLRAHGWHEPGRAAVVASAAGLADQRASVAVVAGNAAAVRLEFPGATTAKPKSEHGPPTVTWVSFGVGAVALGTFAVFGAMAASAASKLGRCTPDCQGMHDLVVSGSRDATIANTALVVAGAGVTLGTVAWIVSASRTRAPALSGMRSIRIAVTGPGLSLRGSF